MLLTSHLSTVTSLLVLFSTFGLHIAIAMFDMFIVFVVWRLYQLILLDILYFTIICMYCCHLLLRSSAICFCIFSFIVSDCCGSSFFFKAFEINSISLSILYGAIFSFCSDIKNWIRNIEQHASDNVNKILVGNKADMDESKRVGVL